MCDKTQKWARHVKSPQLLLYSMRDVTHVTVYMLDMTPPDAWHDSVRCVVWLMWTCDMTHSNVWQDSLRFMTWLSDMTHSYVWHDSFICVTWLILVRVMTHSCVTWLIHMCDMTHSCACHDSFIYVTWLIHMCDMTHVTLSSMWHDSFRCVPWLIQKCTEMRDMTHSSVWHDSFSCVAHFLSEFVTHLFLESFRDRLVHLYSWFLIDSFIYIDDSWQTHSFL